ncbi:MAG: hypothetical protein Q8M92_00930 [Candidatus Subteraquimicrobiales bacterium]|nr:hypothetical protein [Candidatus Subteraquimicrobiales bacterium]
MKTAIEPYKCPYCGSTKVKTSGDDTVHMIICKECKAQHKNIIIPDIKHAGGKYSDEEKIARIADEIKMSFGNPRASVVHSYYRVYLQDGEHGQGFYTVFTKSYEAMKDTSPLGVFVGLMMTNTLFTIGGHQGLAHKAVFEVGKKKYWLELTYIKDVDCEHENTNNVDTE